MIETDPNRKLESILGEMAITHDVVLQAMMMTQAKELYEMIYPAAKHGGRRKRGTSTGAAAFSTYVAGRTGISPRQVALLVWLGRSLSEESKGKLKMTPLGKRTRTLVRLAKLPADVQREILSGYEPGDPDSIRSIIQMVESRSQTRDASSRSDDLLCQLLRLALRVGEAELGVGTMERAKRAMGSSFSEAVDILTLIAEILTKRHKLSEERRAA